MSRIIEWLTSNSLELFIGAVAGLVSWINSPYKGNSFIARCASCATSIITCGFVSVLVGGYLADYGIEGNTHLFFTGIVAMTGVKLVEQLMQKSDRVLKFLEDRVNPLK